MSTIIRLIIAVATVVALMPVACAENVTSIEIAQLPRFARYDPGQGSRE